MNKTSIDWVKNPDGTQGYTWNPITGCLNGCDYCYARKLANGRLRSRYLANDQTTKEVYGIASRQEFHRGLQDPFYPRFWPERLSIPETRLPTMRNWSAQAWASIANSRRRGIFVCDMSDLFGIGIPEEWTTRILAEIRRHENDRFYLLTKQPQNLIQFSPFPDNCWVGVTITSSGERTLHNMVKVEAKLKFISFEPLLEWRVEMGALVKALQTADIGWVIIGAQTKPYKPPKIEWVEEIVRACDKAGIPVFLKDNLLQGVCFTDGRIKFRQEMQK